MKKCFLSTYHPSYTHGAFGGCWFAVANYSSFQMGIKGGSKKMLFFKDRT
jgi:hypothetical protein